MASGERKMVVTFGEVMLLLTAPQFHRIGQENHFEVCFGGSEANVTVALAQFGTPARYFTRLPFNPIAESCLRQMRGFGVDVEQVQRGGERMGIYFMERGHGARNGQVVYDRAASAVAQIEPESIDWKNVLRDAAWFHFSGITAGISLKAAEAARQGAIAARQLGLTVSCDFNYRARLWSQEACAKTMHELIPHTDMLIANENHLQRMIVKDFPPSQSGSDESDLDYAAALGQKLFSMYKLRWVVVTLRRTYSTHRQGIGAVWVEPHSRAPGYFRQTDVLEPVGGGDALTAGLIHRMLAGATPQEAVEFGVSAACFKHSYPGDFFVGTEADVTACLAGASGKRFQR